MDRIKHLGHRAQHDVDDGIDDGKAENALFQVPKDTFFELQQRNEQHCYADDVDFYKTCVRHSRNLNLMGKYKIIANFLYEKNW